MSMSNSDLRPGDLRETAAGDIFVYLGYYQGQPPCSRPLPMSGYLYILIGRRPASNQGVARMIHPDNVRHVIKMRTTWNIDLHAAYTKSYKAFENWVGWVDLSCLQGMDCLERPFQLRRLGARKPRYHRI